MYNKIIENKETLKNITNRLNRKDSKVCLLDKEDNSIIDIEDDLLRIISSYYMSRYGNT